MYLFCSLQFSFSTSLVSNCFFENLEWGLISEIINIFAAHLLKPPCHYTLSQSHKYLLKIHHNPNKNNLGVLGEAAACKATPRRSLEEVQMVCTCLLSTFSWRWECWLLPLASCPFSKQQIVFHCILPLAPRGK